MLSTADPLLGRLRGRYGEPTVRDARHLSTAGELFLHMRWITSSQVSLGGS
jgi:hypothetical protein